jgi:phosphohistidine phosphatase
MSTHKKTLVIIRHAKSDWSVGVDDFNRPLNERGRGDAPRMGRYLSEQQLIPDHILTSSAIRAKHTAQLIAHELAIPLVDIQQEEGLYHAAPSQLLKHIHALPQHANRAFVVGHNPGLSELVSRLTNENIELKTCCVAVLTTHADNWEEVFWETCHLQSYFSPKNL